jgi:hypothetical protein
MAHQLPDAFAWIKAINESGGKALPDGDQVQAPAKVTVRYSIANDSHKATGAIYVVGALFRNGVRVKPGGQPNVVPAQQIDLQPGQVWVKEYTVDESESVVTYEARLLADVGSFVAEDDEKNNLAQRTFTVIDIPA